LTTVLIGTSLSIVAPVANAAPSAPYSWKNVNTGAGGGFVPGIIFNEKEKDLIYARTDIGGAYRWNPADNSWIPLLDRVGWADWGKNGVDALATDPVDPNRLYIAAGMYTNGWDPNHGYIMRSADRGNTWQSTQLPFYIGGNMPGRSMGERLAIDPNKNSVLYFGARSGNGLWRSTDYGVTWNKVTAFPNPGTYVQDPSYPYTADIMGLAWITFDKSTGTAGNATQTIYVGVADKAQSIYRSTDGGATWAAVPGQPTGFIPHHGEISNGYLYITYNDSSGPYDGVKGDVYKYNTTTGVWTNISPIPSASEDDYFGYGGLAIDRTNPNTLMVATLNSWWPDANIYRSTDGGATWTSIWSWDGYPTRKLLYSQDISAAPWLDFASNPQPPEPAVKLGWMMGDLEIDPFNPNRMMYGTGATIYGTNNLLDWGTSKKVNISVMAKNLEEMAVLDLVSPPSGAPLLSGVGDVSGFRHNDLNVPPSKIFKGPDSTSSIDFAESSPSFVARVGTSDTAAAIAFSYDGGGNWYNPGQVPGTAGGGQIAVSSDGSSLVYSTPDVGVYRSAGGSSWSASTGVPTGAKIVSDRVNKNKFYAFADGKAYVSTNAGVSFTQTAATGLPSTGTLRSVFGIEGDLWIAGGSDTTVYGLWHSTDGGASFAKLSNVQEADVVGFGKAAPGQTYPAVYTSAKIDNVRGLFRSNDAGASWVRINDDQHQYGVTNIVITGDQRTYGRVYVGTNGRGIIYGDPSGTTPPVNNSSITPTSASFDKKTANQADIGVTMTLNGNTLSGIKNGSASLVSGTDYTVSGSTVTIKKSYLAAQPVGTTNLTFDFSAGADPVLAIAIADTTVTTPVNSTITPTSASFDKKTANQADIAVAMTLNGNTLSGIKNGSTSLVSGTDYTVSGSSVTIKKSYLAARAVGTTNLTFDFSAGVDPVLAIAIVDTTVTTPVNSTIAPTSASFDKNTANQADVAVALTLNGNTLSGIKNGSATLVSGTDYTVSGSSVTIKKGYLAAQAVGTTTLTFNFSAGAAATLAVSIVDTTVTTPVSGSFKIQMYSGATAASSNTISPRIKIVNTGTSALNLANVKLRYYYTIDANKEQAFWCDWSHVGSSNVTGAFVAMATPKTGADTYFEIGFTSSAGSLAAGASAEIQIRISRTDWSNYTQTGDYSFSSTGSAYVDWTKMTGYLSGQLQWGIEP